jgi:hypothetical protein
VLFFAFLFLPLAVVAVFAFNDAPVPGAALARFHAGLVFRRMTDTERVGLFADGPMLASIWTSVVVASPGSRCCRCLVGTANAFLLERASFRGKSGSVDADAGAAGDSGRDPGHFHPGVRQPPGQLATTPGAWSWSFCARACRWWCWASSPTLCRLPR